MTMIVIELLIIDLVPPTMILDLMMDLHVVPTPSQASPPVLIIAATSPPATSVSPPPAPLVLALAAPHRVIQVASS